MSEKRTTVKTLCPECGDIRTSIDNVVLRLPADNPGANGEYRFTCPTCNKIVLKDASQNIISILTDAGAKIELYTPPLELLERPIDGVLSVDGLIDLGIAAEDGSLFDKITRKFS